MQVKKFEAPTIQEALKVIKQEMGPDAIILSTKENRKGFGLMKKGSVEVTAAISKKDLAKKTAAEKLLPEDVKQKIWSSTATTQKSIYEDYFEKQLRQSEPEKINLSPAAREKRKAPTATRYIDIQDDEPAKPTVGQKIGARFNEAARKIDTAFESLGAGTTNREVPGNEKQGARVQQLEAEIDDLKSMIRHIASQRINPAPAVEAPETAKESENTIEAFQTLVSAGVEKRIARAIVKAAEFDLSELEKLNADALNDRIASQIIDRVRVLDILKEIGTKSGTGPEFLIIVGPTGVGKTTTAAKIASQALLDRRLRVGLINLDSYRVGAADQLATYAKLMNCPFRSVTTKSELQQAAYDFAALDLVIVDTTGRSQRDQESLSDMKSMLQVLERQQTLLTISATTKEGDLNDIVSRFKVFSPKALIFSKLDETTAYGAILNTQFRTEIPLAYFTVGQRVPEDIERASQERVAALVLDL